MPINCLHFVSPWTCLIECWVFFQFDLVIELCTRLYLKKKNMTSVIWTTYWKLIMWFIDCNYSSRKKWKQNKREGIKQNVQQQHKIRKICHNHMIQCHFITTSHNSITISNHNPNYSLDSRFFFFLPLFGWWWSGILWLVLVFLLSFRVWRGVCCVCIFRNKSHINYPCHKPGNDFLLKHLL